MYNGYNFAADENDGTLLICMTSLVYSSVMPVCTLEAFKHEICIGMTH